MKSVCVKDHKGRRGEPNFPLPGSGQIDHEEMFRILFQAGFSGPIALETVSMTDNPSRMPAEVIDQRVAQTRQYLAPLLERLSSA